MHKNSQPFAHSITFILIANFLKICVSNEKKKQFLFKFGITISACSLVAIKEYALALIHKRSNVPRNMHLDKNKLTIKKKTFTALFVSRFFFSLFQIEQSAESIRLGCEGRQKSVILFKCRFNFFLVYSKYSLSLLYM